MRHIIATILLAMAGISAMAQGDRQNDAQLAYSYYNGKEYDKAAFLFEKLYGSSKSLSYFDLYITSLVRSDQAAKAEKAARKESSASQGNPCYMVILGKVYAEQNRRDKALQEYDKAIEHIQPSRNSVIELTNMFLSASENGYAEKALIKGQERTGLDFSQDLFTVYASSRDFGKLSETALDIIERDASKISDVERNMQFHISNDTNNEFYDILRDAVQQRIQKTPMTQFSELMIWLQMMKKNFKMAIIQAKALDRRLGEQGQRLVTIGDHAVAAKDYAAASEAYKYVADKGNGGLFYQKASFGLLKAMYEQVSDGSVSDIKEIEYLESKYASSFADFGISASTIPDVLNYAQIESRYLNKPDSARKILEGAAAAPGISYAQKAQINLALGDVLLYKGEQWDALMTYAKVEGDNKQNEYGDEAKFRKARVAYYTGNFKWAASQLDALKAATTKLVANDAMELSLLISDNAERESEIAGDTTSAIAESEESSKDLRIYARADMYAHQNLPGKALESLDSIALLYKTSPLADEAMFLKAKIYEKSRQADSAAHYYKRVADEHSYDILADKACFFYARLAGGALGNAAEAKKYYMKILSDYPGSVYAVEARERYREISE